MAAAFPTVTSRGDPTSCVLICPSHPTRILGAGWSPHSPFPSVTGSQTQVRDEAQGGTQLNRLHMAGWTTCQHRPGPPHPNYIVTNSLGSANEHSCQRHCFFFLSLFFTFTSLFNIILFIYFWLLWVFIAVRALCGGQRLL